MFDAAIAVAKKSMCAFENIAHPSLETLKDVVKSKSSMELEGIMRWGSEIGKQLAKEELKSRGHLPKTFWEKLFS